MTCTRQGGGRRTEPPATCRERRGTDSHVKGAVARGTTAAIHTLAAVNATAPYISSIGGTVNQREGNQMRHWHVGSSRSSSYEAPKSLYRPWYCTH